MESVLTPSFHKDILHLDAEVVCNTIASKLKRDILQILRRRGGIVGISGGIDSSVVLALSARALGPNRVLGVMMPEHDTAPESLDLAQQLADQFGVETVVEDVTETLRGMGCYQRRDEAIRRVFPEYDPRVHKVKIVLPQNALNENTLNVFSVTLVDPDGVEKRERLSPDAYLQIVAASNFKQRSRMTMLYYHAEARNYAVIGTANKHEHRQGFFVKHGDGGVDVMPIINLYKTQVYELAEYLDIPEAIIQRPSTSDTYSAECTQQEFFFQMPFEQMDLLWHAYEESYPMAEVAAIMNMTEDQVGRAFQNFERKQQTTDYLRMAPISDYYVCYDGQNEIA